MATNLKDIADQYAKAIFELSSEQDNVEDTRKDLDTLKVVFENNPNFVTIGVQMTSTVRHVMVC